MNNFYTFAGTHPLMTIFLACVVYSMAAWPFRIMNHWIRSRNIKNAGWPPSHLDGDGDFKEIE